MPPPAVRSYALKTYGPSCLPQSALVEAADFPEGRGVACTRDVKQGEELVCIPLADCWHGVAARATLPDELGSLSDFNAAALHLLVERAKGEASGRWHHLSTLPQAYDSTFFWTEDELDGLRGSPWLELARRFAKEVDEDWLALLNSPARSFISEHGFQRADYMWAYATLKSRSAEAVVGGVAGSRLMAPGFDLFNHSDTLTPGTSHYYSEERQMLIIVATYDHAAGEQAFISYGTASNGSLLLAGGFVLPSNRFDYLEVPLTSPVDASRLQTYMMAAPDADATGGGGELATFEFLQVPDDDTLVASEGGCAPFTTRHLLTLSKPLPLPLLTYVRLDRLSDDELALHARRGAKEGGKPLYELVRADAPLDAMNEVLSLGALRGVLSSLLAGYPSTLEQDDATLAAAAAPVRAPGKSSGDEGSAAAAALDGGSEGGARLSERARSALLLVRSEKCILRASLAAVSSRLLPQLQALVGDAAKQESACRKSAQPWAGMLARRASLLANAQNAARVHRTFERLHACSLGDGDAETAALAAQGGAALFVLLAGLASHPLAPATQYIPEAGPFGDGIAAAEAGAAASPLPPLPPLSPLMLAGATAAVVGEEAPEGRSATSPPPLPYLALYVEKLRFWGCYLLAQWGVARAVAITECDTMRGEALGLRDAWSYALPTEAALAAIGQRGPIVEVGAGNGVWAAALRQRGVDVVAYDTPVWSDAYAGGGAAGAAGKVLMGKRVEESEGGGVREGGAESAAAHADRALLLVWPDYAGRGTYAREALRAYTGQTLLLVGEWRGRTFGGGAQGPTEDGEAFSAAFQQQVESDFEVVEQHRLPSWPWYVDCLVVWRRKASPPIVA